MSSSSACNPGLGEAVRELRERANLTPEEVAGDSEISNAYLSKIENGQVDAAWGTLRKLARALGVDFGFLAEEAERHEKRYQ